LYAKVYRFGGGAAMSDVSREKIPRDFKLLLPIPFAAPPLELRANNLGSFAGCADQIKR